ncbi:hypothetical protein JCM5350_001339 [Sporobolomyces pararoseus]
MPKIRSLVESAEKATQGHNPTAAAAYELILYLFEHHKLTDLSASGDGPLATRPSDAWHASWLEKYYPDLWNELVQALRDYACFRTILADLGESATTSEARKFVRSVRNYGKEDMRTSWSTKGIEAAEKRYYIVVDIFEYSRHGAIETITADMMERLDKLIVLHSKGSQANSLSHSAFRAVSRSSLRNGSYV